MVSSQILQSHPIGLHIVNGACCNSIDVRDSPRCESGTRIRIQQTIQQWAEGDTGNLFFWLAGPAGTGKSTITRTVADSFVRQKRVVAGYFFKRGEQGRNDTNRIFSTLATQLANGIPSFKTSLEASLASFESDAMGKKELNFQFDKLFRTPLSCLSPINMSHLPAVIIIDALDECERPEYLPLILTLLLEVCSTTTMNLHLRVLFTSRSAPIILDAFRPHKAVRKLLLHQEFSADNNSDVRTFLKAKFDGIRTK